jgi:hypothetical protein
MTGFLYPGSIRPSGNFVVVPLALARRFLLSRSPLRLACRCDFLADMFFGTSLFLDKVCDLYTHFPSDVTTATPMFVRLGSMPPKSDCVFFGPSYFS